MDKYIGFDISNKSTVCCVYTQKDNKSRFKTIKTELSEMKEFLRAEKKGGYSIHLTYEVGGHAGLMYDTLKKYVTTQTVGNPSAMKWIFKTSKKNDRIDAQKQAILNSIGQIPAVHMPSKKTRVWKKKIEHRKVLIGSRTRIKNRIKALFRENFLPKWTGGKLWWTKSNIAWLWTMSE